MSEKETTIRWTSIAVKKDTTLLRLQRLGSFTDSYDAILNKLLDAAEGPLLQRVREEALVNTQR
jgi:hypothetical protein